MADIIPIEVITGKIFQIRGEKVMIDGDLARLYGVETRVFNQAVKRNGKRFPEDFMFQLTKEEADSLRSQFVTLKRGEHSKYLPYVFTEQGIAMLSSVLNSERAIQVNVQIIRAFVQLRKMFLEHQALRYAIEGLERRVSKNERNIQIAINAIQSILNPPEDGRTKKRMGFYPDEKADNYRE